jgi:hypothetical protein
LLSDGILEAMRIELTQLRTLAAKYVLTDHFKKVVTTLKIWTPEPLRIIVFMNTFGNSALLPEAPENSKLMLIARSIRALKLSSKNLTFTIIGPSYSDFVKRLAALEAVYE